MQGTVAAFSRLAVGSTRIWVSDNRVAVNSLRHLVVNIVSSIVVSPCHENGGQQKFIDALACDQDSSPFTRCAIPSTGWRTGR